MAPDRPLHEQVTAWLRERIGSSEYAPGERLPSEAELISLFDVSRITVRRALGTLEAEGQIVRRQGLGSFVAPPRISQGLVRLTDFAEDMRRAGLEAHSVVAHRGREPAPAFVAAELGLKPGATVERLDRRRTGGDDAIAWDRTWLPLYYGQLLEGHDLAERTIFEILENEYEIPVVEGHFRIEAAVAGPDEATALGVEVGAPLLRVRRTSYTVAQRPIYVQLRYYRADRVAFDLWASRGDAVGAEGLRLERLEPVFDHDRNEMTETPR